LRISLGEGAALPGSWRSTSGQSRQDGGPRLAPVVL